MHLFRARTRRSSIAGDSAPVALRRLPRSRSPGSPSSNSSHISGILPTPGMLGILITDGVQMTIKYLEEISYSGPPPAKNIVIVEPVPAFRVGNQLPLFICGHHFLAVITDVNPYTHSILAGDVPRLSYYPDTEPLDIDPTIVSTTQNPQPIPDVLRKAAYPTPSPDIIPPNPLPSSQRPSSVALDTSRTYQESFQQAQTDFIAATSSLQTPSSSKMHPFPLPTNPPTGQVSHSSLQIVRNSPDHSPASHHRRRASDMVYTGRARTTSDMGESQISVPTRSRNNDDTQSNTSRITRRRLHSDAGSTQPRSNASLARSGTVHAQGAQPTRNLAARKPSPRLSLMDDPPTPASKTRSLLSIAAAKVKIPFTRHSGLTSGPALGLAPGWKEKISAPSAPMVTRTTLTTTDALLGGVLMTSGGKSDVAHSPIPEPGKLPTSVTYVDYSTPPVSGPSTVQGGRGDLLLDPLSTPERALRNRRHSEQPSVAGSATEHQRRRSKRDGYVPPAINPYEQHRQTTANGDPAISASRPPRPSSKVSSGKAKDLPSLPLPAFSPLMHSPSPESMKFGSEKEYAEKESRQGKNSKSLGNALDLTPPQSPRDVIARTSVCVLPEGNLAGPSSPQSHPRSPSEVPDLRPGSNPTSVSERQLSEFEFIGFEDALTNTYPQYAPYTSRSTLSFDSGIAAATEQMVASSSRQALTPNGSTSTVSTGGTRRWYYEPPLSHVTERSGEYGPFSPFSPPKSVTVGSGGELSQAQARALATLGSSKTRVISSG
ncbi:hypothetical protein BDN70DRAFT_920075 [Pholiota conissans]|uniref:Uncharacterized protein n=1 Tax=Pholiota conissans TaxID=109636 RepID=A0A9P6D2F2_9AGAR|nr:hypothetical protein BDN70DRAFT_920075 [Pholiota conissans]